MHIMAMSSENRAGLRPIPPDLYGLAFRQLWLSLVGYTYELT